MIIPSKYANVVFSALLSAIMTAVVSAFVIISTQGLSHSFLLAWITACATTWPVAFPTVLVVAPWVRKVVIKITG